MNNIHYSRFWNFTQTRAAIFSNILCLALLCANRLSLAQSNAFHADDVRAYADTVMVTTNLNSISYEKNLKILKRRFPFNAAIAVPVFGTILVDMNMFGEVRRSAVLGDWLLGGVIPAGLALTAALADDMPGKSRDALLYSSLGLYSATRVIVCITINHHLITYNKHIKMRLGIEKRK